MNLSRELLSQGKRQTIESLLAKSSNNPPELEDIWHLMDNVWDEIGCDNKKPDWDKISEFYKHPVWILNGLFIEQHDISMQHRHAISDWAIKNKLKHVLDYGGGFGTLARLIAAKDISVLIDIYEPHPSEYAILKTKDYPNIHFVKSLNKQYECLISIDVLEHVSNPLNIFAKMIELTEVNGYILVANNFWPVIKCHLPATFHLRYTFNMFADLMGLELVGGCEGSHATVYVKQKSLTINWWKIRKYEQMSQLLFYFLNFAHCNYQKVKRSLK
jgi:2-polyprenyl-6-hydroxyphenyl methylase/3-demethylubiquinone-9 3-methyltransferase